MPLKTDWEWCGVVGFVVLCVVNSFTISSFFCSRLISLNIERQSVGKENRSMASGASLNALHPPEEM